MKMIDTEITLSFNPHKVKENFLKNLLDFSTKKDHLHISHGYFGYQI